MSNNDKKQLKEQLAAERKSEKAKRVAEQKVKREAEKAALEKESLLERKLFLIARLQKGNKKWYKLDNAALMYPLVARRESASVFRLAVQLTQEVDPVVLQYAVNDVFPRFPTICGCLKRGFFWPFIDRPNVPIIVKKQTKIPGRPIKLDGKRSQIRVNYFGNQISVEFFHSATDGNGGLLFLNTLLRCYFNRLGIDCERVNCYDYRDEPSLAEMRDNFANIAVRKNPPPLPPIVKTKIINGKYLKNKKYYTVRGICSSKQLREVARSYDATVTEFLGAIQLLALDNLAKATNTRDERPIRTLIPVNLRRLYNVETVRNFSSYIFYQYNGQTDIREIISDIKKQTAEQMTDDYFRGMVSYNYNSGTNPALKVVPLAIKQLVVSAIVKGRGDGIVNSSTLSNLGVVQAPKEFADYVARYEFMLGRPVRKTNNMTVATYNDVCVISITNRFIEKDCERYFFTKLAELGIDIAIESDIWEEAE